MGIAIIFSVAVKPESRDELMAYMKEILPDTRGFDGCQGVDVYTDMDNPNIVVLYEKWDSRGHYEKYHHWREETGVLDVLRSMFDGPPISRHFLELADV